MSLLLANYFELFFKQKYYVTADESGSKLKKQKPSECPDSSVETSISNRSEFIWACASSFT